MNTQINMSSMCINASVCITVSLDNSAPANAPGASSEELSCTLPACAQYQSCRLEQQLSRGIHTGPRKMEISSSLAHTEQSCKVRKTHTMRLEITKSNIYG